MKPDQDYMLQAMFLALSRIGITSPNPPVGAIVVKNGQIVSKGGTQICGGSHAEVCALESAGENARAADLYVTLEPCCHHGKTPPCTDAIINAGIRRVIIPITDPNPKVSGKGVETLRRAGIEVVILEEYQRYAQQILSSFFTLMQKGRPHIIHKTACTADGFTATTGGDSKWISSSTSRLVTHRLRSFVDAIVVGRATFELDSPSLTCRMDEFSEEQQALKSVPMQFSGEDNIVLRYLLSDQFDHCTRQPLRILIGHPEKITGREPFFHDDNYLVFSRKKNAGNDNQFINKIKKSGNLILCNQSDDLAGCVVNELRVRGHLQILVEGGARTAGAFFSKGYIDEYMGFIAPKLIGGGRPVYEGSGVSKIADGLTLTEVTVALLGQDIIYHGYRR
jgi:diaminohydroxyphosphoribosylaminopyrimidine deaminase/5-amino-6-(5-phosphoribosylamino)uracil reductase